MVDRTRSVTSLLVGIASALAAPCWAQNAPENIALGRPATYTPTPSYALCTDADDLFQLTDGIYTEGYFWVQPTTVGWQGAELVLITIDLGSVRPISGVSYSTAAGAGQVPWPARILVGVSDDGIEWRTPGDLVALSAAAGEPPAEGYGTHRYVATELTSRGRYVRLAVAPNGPYCFCDEIEVYEGPDALLEGEAIDAVTHHPDIAVPEGWSPTRVGILRRLWIDLDAARTAVAKADLSAELEGELLERLDIAAQRVMKTPEMDEETFRSIFPLNDTHAAILGVHGVLMQARGLPELFAWRKHRYDPLSPHETPEAIGGLPEIRIEMMQAEVRADIFLLTNASDQAKTAMLRIVGLPGEPQPPWLSVSAVPWTDTLQRVPVAAALPEAEFADGVYWIPLPAGLTCRVWLTVDSHDLPPGRYEGAVEVAAPGLDASLLLVLDVAPVRMERPRISLGLWDYTDGMGAYGITPRNVQAAIDLQASHGVDSPWAKAQALPWPRGEDFDAQQELAAPLSFDALDEWIVRWPDARRYLVFAAVGSTFAGVDMDAPEFAPRVGAWAEALAEHVRDLGLEPAQLGLLLVDEPYSDEQDAIVAAWANAINARAPELTLFQDPIWLRPDETAIQDALTQVDILCPNVSIFYAGGPPVWEYFAQRFAAGQELWFYQCSGPARLFDPSRYHRLQSWHAFRHGATGLGFWAFGDTGGAVSSWNEYTGLRASFAPAFIGIDDATDGIHWQAVREGMEDYEYLATLRDAAATTDNDALRAEAEALLAEAPAAVIGDYTPDYAWVDGIDRAAPDTYRLRVLEMLRRLAE